MTVEIQNRPIEVGSVRQVVDLMKRAQDGDRSAFDELAEVARHEGKPADHYYSEWSRHILMCKIKARASETNLMARASVEYEIRSAERGLVEPGDGPIERLIIGRASLCLADTMLAERDYQHWANQDCPLGLVEAVDRRRERSQKMLFSALKTLAAVRQLNRPVVQVNLGDGNVNVLKA